MSRLIDGDALLEELNDINVTTLCALIEEQRITAFYVYCKVVQAIEKMPTIDAVPVVRCKDCRFYVQEDEANGYCDPSIWEQAAMRTIYDFCSKGARKDEAD